MTDPTPTPPPLDLAALDLAALKEHAQSILRGENISEIEPSDVLALIARVTAAESSLARYIVERTRFGDAMAASAVPAVVGAIMRELTTDSDERAREATARAEADRKNAQWFGDRAIKADTRAALAEAKLDSLQMFGDLWRARAEAAEAKIAAVREALGKRAFWLNDSIGSVIKLSDLHPALDGTA